MKTKETPVNTPGWLRSFKGCEQLSDEQASDIITSIKTLAAILLKSDTPKEMLPIDNQLVVSSDRETNNANNVKNAA